MVSIQGAARKASGAARRPLTRAEALELSQTLRVIADPTRLQLLSMMHGSESKEACVTDLAEALDLSAATISHHLSLMHDGGLLTRERRGRQVWYSIRAERRESVSDLLG